MLPKVQAAISFVSAAAEKPESTHRVALITLLQKAKDGIEGNTGTVITL
jgi:carbamate kinase